MMKAMVVLGFFLLVIYIILSRYKGFGTLLTAGNTLSTNVASMMLNIKPVASSSQPSTWVPIPKVVDHSPSPPTVLM